MKFRISCEGSPNLANNQSIADANTMPTEGHKTVDKPHTTAAEPYTIAAEPHKMAAEMYNFSLSSLREGHTNRRSHNSYTTTYWEYDAFELNHEGLVMVRNIRPTDKVLI